MIVLNEQQVLFIRAELTSVGVSHEPLQEELLDHLCCVVEKTMTEGATFSQAVTAAFSVFKEDEIKEIQDYDIQLQNQKMLIMKRLSLLFLGVMLLFTTVTFAVQQDPPTIAPIAGTFKITSSYGQRMHPIQQVKKMHQGIDIKAPIGTPVVATAAGTVIKTEYDKDGYGKYIVIRHDEHYETVYSQLSEFRVTPGQEVAQGEVIGLVGNSGLSTAPHLHYEVRKDGQHENPEAYLRP